MEGAEGKIKGGGVTPMLKHCLHIGFANSTPKGLGVTVFAFFPAMLEKSGGVTSYEANALSLGITDSTGRKSLEMLEFGLIFKLGLP